MNNYRIEGRASNADAWGTMHAMTQANADSASEGRKPEREARALLTEWQRASADLNGRFHGWQFRIARD